MLTLTQKTLVQETFAAVAPIADDVAALFYRRLFEIDPSLQEMFRGNMAEQRLWTPPSGRSDWRPACLRSARHAGTLREYNPLTTPSTRSDQLIHRLFTLRVGSNPS